MKVCILACGRSGTVYTAKCLNAVGIRVGHEQPGRDGQVGAIFWKGNAFHIEDYDVVLHQVRYPLHVISSLTTANPRTLRTYCRRMAFPGCKLPGTMLEAAAFAWLIYTEWAQGMASWYYHVEDMVAVFPRLTSLFDRESDLPDFPTNTHHRPHERYTFKQLRQANRALADLVMARGIKYGYFGAAT